MLGIILGPADPSNALHAVLLIMGVAEAHARAHREWRPTRVPLAEILGVVESPETLEWFASRDFEATGSPEATAVAVRIYELADQQVAVPYALIERLADLDAQVIDGRLEARRPVSELAVLRIISVRGDDWDLETDDAAIRRAIERLPNVAPRPQ